MEVTATYKNLRMSAQKAREVVRQVRGMNAVQALSLSLIHISEPTRPY